ncbi:MAG: hypothetical protein HN700_09215, partial [Verrucomicrobia bacterium]|nr:hypothetical protein [Verrucomicrobiota bacterium]
FDRGAKAISLSKEAREMLNTDSETLSGEEVIQHILRADVDLLWNGSALLEGDLHVEIMDGHSVRSRSVVADLALAPGSQTFGLLLPAVSGYGNNQSTRAQLTFRSGSKRIDLQQHPCSIPNLNARLLSLVYPIAVVGEDRVRHVAADLRPDWLNPEAAAGNQGVLRTGLCPLQPADFPATPEAYCAADLVVLAGAGVAKLRMVQLDALLTWVRAGGSLCVVNPRGLPEEHQAFLVELFGGEAEAGALLFGPDGEPQGPSLATRRLALGRIALVLREATDSDTLRQDPEWRRVLAFLWRFRANQVAHVVAKGTWNELAEDKATAVDQRAMHQLQHYMRQYKKKLSLQPINFLVRSDHLSVLMPRDMRFVRIGQLALVLAILVLLVGPVDYFVLKRLKLQRYTWFTVPIYVALATVAIVMLANRAMGRHDRRGRLCILDTDAAGVPVRQNDVHLVVPSSHGKMREHIQRALVAPVRIGGRHGAVSADGDAAGHQVVGRYPHDFETAFAVAQWKPMAWRSMTFRPTATFPWQLPQLDDDVWSGKGATAYWKRFEALNEAVPRGAYILTSGAMHMLHEKTWETPMGLGDQRPRRLTILTEAPRIGYFAVVSAVSPTCDVAEEDLYMYDISDPDQAVLVLVWQKGGTVFMSRTPFYRTTGTTPRAVSSARPQPGPPQASANEKG